MRHGSLICNNRFKSYDCCTFLTLVHHVVATLRRGVVRRKTIGREGVSLELTSFQIVFAERERERERGREGRGDVCLRTHETLIGSGGQAGDRIQLFLLTYQIRT